MAATSRQTEARAAVTSSVKASSPRSPHTPSEGTAGSQQWHRCADHHDECDRWRMDRGGPSGHRQWDFSLLGCQENCLDIGTRTDKVSSNDVKPNSDWLMGKPWMRLSLEEAANQKFIRPIEDLKLTHEEKKVVKKGIIFDGCDDNDDRFAVIMAVKVDIQKTAEREAEANYVFSPTRRKFSVFVRITALVLRAVRRFKTKGLLRRIKDSQAK